MSVTVRHSRGSYHVEFLSTAAVVSSISPADLVVTDKAVQSALAYDGDCYAVEPGEQSKCLAVYGGLLEWLAVRGNRKSRIVALGGGVVGDLAGFAAATFLRGVDLVQVPTSLVAMVDSSVGGKVGIDLAAGKNLAGAFWPPTAVIVPVDALRTLPERHFINGMAEVWKYAFIMDRGLHDRLMARPLTVASDDLRAVIETCIGLKRQVVEEDEFESSGRRAILNFGHTVGHAIEHCQKYAGHLHGEAVSVGMVVESRMAEELGVAQPGLSERIEKCLNAQGLPTNVPQDVSIEGLLLAMSRDKKARANGLAFSFVSKIGECSLHEGLAPAKVEEALRDSWR